MKRLALLLLGAAALAGCSNAETKTEELPKVYMTTDISPEGLVRVYDALGIEADGKVAVKISTGEPGGKNYLKPELIGKLVQSVDGTIVECNTAYRGRRFSSEEHLKAAREHGFFEIADVDIMDTEGEIKIPVQDTTHLKYNLVGKNIANYDFMINLAHFKGHAMGGFGGVLKNQSIGVASRNGKAYIHSVGITENPDEMWAHVDDQIGFLESMAAAAQSVHEYFGPGDIVYINVMNNMSIDCDCDSHPADHCSFQENGGTWPPHCVQGTRGAAIHDKFYDEILNHNIRPQKHNMFFKGLNPQKEQYSGYEAVNASGISIEDASTHDIIVVGIASEYCVMETVMDFVKRGFNVSVIVDALAYVDKDGHEKAIAEFRSKGVNLLQ